MKNRPVKCILRSYTSLDRDVEVEWVCFLEFLPISRGPKVSLGCGVERIQKDPIYLAAVLAPRSQPFASDIFRYFLYYLDRSCSC